MVDTPTRTRMPGCADPDCHEDREAKMVRLADGGCCDPCIAPIVRALNAAGIRTIASCCGHGWTTGTITLSDKSELIIARNYSEARRIDRMNPLDINGNRWLPEDPMADLTYADGLRRAAEIAQRFAMQNHDASAKSQRRANRLGDDPFGHGEMAAAASAELSSCAAEAEAIAAAILAEAQKDGG